MAELKTKKTTASVSEFVATITDDAVRKDAKTLVKLMEKVAGAKAKMWGPSIIGFGDHVLLYPNGRTLDWFAIGFSPRKGKFSVYGLGKVFQEKALLARLGKHKTSKGCVYLTSLEGVDLAVLEKLLAKSVILLKKKS
jgi:hypothetical protein